MVNLDHAISKLRACEHLPEAELKNLCEIVRAILVEEPNIQPVRSPVTVCGDIHGQLWDMIEMFRVGGQPGLTNYILMGDFVDRGHFSLETFSLLLAYKARYELTHSLRTHFQQGSSISNSAIQIGSLSSEVITSRDRSLRFMASMMSVSESMVTLTYGKLVVLSSIVSTWLLSSIRLSYVSMEASRLKFAL
ncbi:hypothetical protein PGTUg99_016148 [Puccinia graminis f. sp. tritici]|uniref:protein-serine/threonine phosphatase n=1 Tax=Puccinia graminis f. sp. tritici TaxID=56615 RepID=A0A5B0RDR8_PUCGR|nr:hypothetical protein PGTUg99_016148 [Puccinia graminis f. sp. tritici]